jgi:hypothetical protein
MLIVCVAGWVGSRDMSPIAVPALDLARWRWRVAAEMGAKLR